MAQTEFNNCPKYGVGKMKPTGEAAVSNDPQTGKETGSYREYKCDHCGFPHGGKQIAVTVNEVVGAKENQPANTTTNSPAATTATAEEQEGTTR
jgi:hypothetical protein